MTERAIPSWATDPDEAIPVGYLPRDGQQPDRFFVGDAPDRAIVLLDKTWRESDREEFVGLAAGCWQALTNTQCKRATAVAITIGWFAAFEKSAEKLKVAHDHKLILPQHMSVQ